MSFARTVLLLAFASLAACAHRPASAPPAFGFHSRVDAHRPVRCVVDNDMTPERCLLVGRAVDKINAAVGFELLQAPEIMTARAFIDEVSTPPGRPVTYVMIDKLPAGRLGQTGLSDRTPAIFVVFSPLIWVDADMRDSVLIHELVHAVGADHAPQQGAWVSVERPYWQPGAPVELTPADVTALRAAYPVN